MNIEKLHQQLQKINEAKADRDIICPCNYREKDVRKFGACYCQLYVSKQWNEGAIPETYIPERRPEEKA